MKRHSLPWLLATATSAVCGFANLAAAADTVETWTVGATDVDFYTGYEGIGLEKEERVVYGDIMLGYGIVDRFSAYAGTTLQGEDGFADGAAAHYLGIYGTPLETAHVDLDLFLDFSEGGPDRTFQIRPALELNLDADPDMRTWGLYLRAPLPIYGRKLSQPLHPETEASEITFRVDGTAGVYVTPGDGQQLLLEYDMGYHPDPGEEERSVDVGGVAFGYNVGLTDGLELINELSTDIPQDDEKWSLSLMVGFIASLPSTE